MTMTLYAKKDLKGKSLVITRNFSNLRDTDLGNNPSSIRMTEADDAILLFNKKDWEGGVMYFRGIRTMDSLGKLSQGGELFKGNSVTSVRVTPFMVNLNITYVTSDGRIPGGYPDADQVEVTFTKAIALANAFFNDQKAMITMQIARKSFRDNPRKFDLTALGATDFPADWTNPREIDLVVCNSLRSGVGQAPFPWWGKTIVVAMADTSGAQRSVGSVARTLAHELGHFLGLTHGSGNGQAANIMTQSVNGLTIGESVLSPEQIEEMQTKLARNLSRQGNRIA